MTSKLSSPVTSTRDLRAELRRLYERRSVVENLIRSLEEYQRAPKMGAMRVTVVPSTDAWAEKLAS